MAQGIIFKEVRPVYSTGKPKGGYSSWSSNQGQVPLRVFYNKIPIGLILVKPTIQVQIKGIKQDYKPKSVLDAKRYILSKQEEIIKNI